MFAASEHIRLVVREALAPAATAIHVHRIGDHIRAGIGTHGSSLLRVGSPVVKLAARGQTYRPARDGLGSSPSPLLPPSLADLIPLTENKCMMGYISKRPIDRWMD